MTRTSPRRAPARLRRTAAVGVAAAAMIASGLTATSPSQAAVLDPWADPSLTPDQRSALLLAAMTLEEKVELMTGDQGEGPSAFYNGPIERLGIPELRMADATAGIGSRGWSLPGTGDTATAMPTNLSLAATWDPQRARDYAGVVADEARQTGHSVLLGPNADPTRNPFWGRQGESAGEDPVLNSSIVVPFVQEVQERNVLANLKHYAGYTQEVDRGTGQNSIISERALREVHTRSYEDAIRQADLASVMCSFNKINGVYACESDQALDEILREQLGFDGFVLTDFGAIHSTGPSIQAGTDMETGTAAFYDGVLLAAVEDGTVPELLVDRSVLRILRTMFRLGVFETDYTPTAIPVAEHGAVAREVQEDAITLLKNSNRVLPLSEDIDDIAVIGADANFASALGGSAFVQSTYDVSLLDAMQARGEEIGADVRYEPGNDPVNGASMIESRDMTAVPSSVLRPATGAGAGLTASYFANTTFSGAAGLTRNERQVAYDAGFTGGQPAFATLFGSQVPATPALVSPLGGNDSVRYNGFITAPTTGSYRLGLTGWGDARVFLDGELIVDMTGQGGRRDVRSAALRLVAGEEHALRVEYAATRPLVPLQPGTLLLQWQTPTNAVAPSVRAAAQAAAASDAAVVYVRTYETEERDKVSLKLPQNADQLIREVRRANPETVVVLTTGGPVTMPWLCEVRGVLQNFFGGQEEGNALTRIIFGDEDPSGHLPITFPRNESTLPPGVNNPWSKIGNLDVPFSEDVNIGYRGYLAGNVPPLFPFGFGLSYSRFALDRTRVGGFAAGADDTTEIEVRVRNTGARTGTEVVQVYLGRLPGVPRPVRKLGGYAKVELPAGGSAEATISIDRREFSYWDADADEWVTPAGTVPVYVGTSATSITRVGTIRLP